MVGRTLRDLRERLTALASPNGRYVVACARTGERPTPIAGLRFGDRETAAAATEIAAMAAKRPSIRSRVAAGAASVVLALIVRRGLLAGGGRGAASWCAT